MWGKPCEQAMIKSLLFSSLLLLGSFIQAQLSIPQIMQGDAFVGHLPEDLSLLPNDVPIFTWRQAEDDHRVYYQVKAGKLVRLTDLENHSYPKYGYEWNNDRTAAVYTQGGNLFLWEKGAVSPETLILTTDYLHQEGWTKKSIYYTQGDNAFVYDLNKGTTKQLTNFVHRFEPKEAALNYLEFQEQQLFLYHNKPEREHGENPLAPAKIYIHDQQVRSLVVSPNEQYVTYQLMERASTEATEVQHHIDPKGYTSTSKARPKVGRKDDAYSFYVYNTDKKEVKSFDFNDLSKLNEAPNYYKEYGIETYQNKGLIFHGPYYNLSGSRAILEVKSLDNKHRWIVELNLQEGSFTELEAQHSTAWIGGPGISGWNEEPGNIDWLDEDTFYYQSEASGYSHLYTYSFKTKKKTQITEGNYEVHETRKLPDAGKLMVIANKTHPGNRDVYILDVKKKSMTPLLTQDGKYEPAFSSNGKQLYFLHSFKNKPTELYVNDLEKSTETKQLTQSLTDEFKSYKWFAPEVIEIPTIDASGNIYARLYQPEADKKNGAAVIFVHGAGYLQNAHNYWSLYFREYMFHNFLRDQGYTILDIDYRASEGYGRDWRTAIYRHMGGKDLLDQLAGRDYLINELGIDENKVGIYGGSYGGFITLMALLTEPGKFQCGAALRSVTDWAHYNHEYTSNILNTPEEDSLAFQRSSPIYFADNLQDELIMLHGMVDDNVQFQDVVRLSQRFIELGKEGWEMAIYPVEAHGFKEPTSWIDEYTRIYKLFEAELLGKR